MHRRRARLEAIPDERSTRSATSRYTLRVAADDEHLRIHFADPSFQLGGDSEPLPAPVRAQIVAQVADLKPDYVVSRAGEFVAIHDLPAFRTRLQALVNEIFPEVEQVDVTKVSYAYP